MTWYLWDKVVRRTVGLAIIAGLAATLAGAGAARAQTQITSCPFPGHVISTPGTYVLANDLTCSGNGIDIAVSNVNLMLNGHTITGPGPTNGTGVNICAISPPFLSCSLTPRISNIQVQGPGLLQNFANGIFILNVDNSQIQNVVSAFNTNGMLSVDSTTLQYNANVAAGNASDGFQLNNDTNDQVQQNTATVTGSSVKSGIALVGGSGHQVHNNESDANSCHGIYIDSTNSQIHDNNAFGNGIGDPTNPACAGIYAESGATGNDIQNNTAEGNKHFDLEDVNTSCDSNNWHNDTFFTANQSCVQ